MRDYNKEENERLVQEMDALIERWNSGRVSELDCKRTAYLYREGVWMPIEIDWQEVTDLKKRLEKCQIEQGDCQKMLYCLKALDELRRVVEAQKISILQYTRMMLGIKTESARKVTGRGRNNSDLSSGIRDKNRTFYLQV